MKQHKSFRDHENLPNQPGLKHPMAALYGNPTATPTKVVSYDRVFNKTVFNAYSQLDSLTHAKDCLIKGGDV